MKQKKLPNKPESGIAGVEVDTFDMTNVGEKVGSSVAAGVIGVAGSDIGSFSSIAVRSAIVILSRRGGRIGNVIFGSSGSRSAIVKLPSIPGILGRVMLTGNSGKVILPR